MDHLQQKLEGLKQDLKSLGSAAVAFSGGVDSAFLLAAARQVLGDKVVAVTARSCTLPKRELEEARAFAQAGGIRHIEFDFPVFETEGFGDNPPDRCYHCKTAILKQIRAIAATEGILHVIEGSNVDDAGDYRPGMRAIQEQGVLSPLKAAGLTKAEIRRVSREWGLPTWKKQSAACLASRFAYGEAITREKLAIVEQGEEYLRECGFGQLRVRIHGELARIELEEEDFQKVMVPKVRKELADKFRRLGFAYVTLDVQGYRMGSMNEVLKRG